METYMRYFMDCNERYVNQDSSTTKKILFINGYYKSNKYEEKCRADQFARKIKLCTDKILI